MIRDFRTRGADAEKTILTWGDVRHGEEEYIFTRYKKPALTVLKNLGNSSWLSNFTNEKRFY